MGAHLHGVGDGKILKRGGGQLFPGADILLKILVHVPHGDHFSHHMPDDLVVIRQIVPPLEEFRHDQVLQVFPELLAALVGLDFRQLPAQRLHILFREKGADLQQRKLDHGVQRHCGQHQVIFAGFFQLSFLCENIGDQKLRGEMPVDGVGQLDIGVIVAGAVEGCRDLLA